MLGRSLLQKTIQKEIFIPTIQSEALDKGLSLPGVGVAMFIAGVPMGVLPGVRTGVLPPIWLAGVSSQRDFLLLAPGVGVSPMESPPLSVRGVSAQPLPWPGVSKEKQTKYSQKAEQYILQLYCQHSNPFSVLN